MSRLEIESLGIRFPNPFVLAAGPPTASGSMVKEAFEEGWGGAILKTIGLEPTPHPCPRVEMVKKRDELTGMVNIELITELTLDVWEDEIKSIRDAFPSRPLIASVMGGPRPEDWQQVVHRLERQGVDAFEMNVSCPNFAEERGAQLGQDPESLAVAVGWVREATELPVIVKLTPNVTDIVSLARVAKEAGADAVTATNTLSGLAGIDLHTFAPLPTVGGSGIYGGYSGSGLKPVSLRCTSSIAKSVDLPIMGCGGIERWQDAAEYVAVGATVVQLCTAVMWHGFGIVSRLVDGLETYLTQTINMDLEDLRGRALPQIGTFADLDLSTRMVALVDAERCTGCGICVEACRCGGYQAIALPDETAEVNDKKCDGCGLCVGLCPVDAITMHQRAMIGGKA